MSNNPEDNGLNGADFLAFLMGRGAQCSHEVKLTQALCVLGALTHRVSGGTVHIPFEDMKRVEGMRIEVQEHEDGSVTIKLGESPQKQPTHEAPARPQ
ncbi:hypothetical protein [Stenotrophomonas phage A1432]|uniref:Uncharacterized protein n=1 Tax=Stenotrophomonas phage A1432 TaxID=2930315 RepID=A0A9E7N170_9CAUD|nr:hypothetical protein P9A45_gp41 [Stenotrophomonas phage A1432]UTC27989.1 hypothetical protein [Stenotrophomonas phage A1432]